MIQKEKLLKKGYILLKEVNEYSEFLKLGQEESIDDRVCFRLFHNKNRVIVYRPTDNLIHTNQILFDGELETIDLLELIYNLVKNTQYT